MIARVPDIALHERAGTRLADGREIHEIVEIIEEIISENTREQHCKDLLLYQSSFFSDRFFSLSPVLYHVVSTLNR